MSSDNTSAGVGGSYVLDPKTGARQLVERTFDPNENLLPAAPAGTEQPAATAADAPAVAPKD
jgi:hypothetical protein